MLFVQVFHFSCSFLFWLVCVPFGSGSRLCLEQDIFVSAVRSCSSPESRFCFRKNCFGYTVKDHSSLWPGFLLVYTVRDRLALGASSLFGTNFCWFGSRNRFSFLLNEMLLCLRSETVRLWEPVLVIYGPGPFSFEGEARRWRCHRCCYFCSQRYSEAGNCVWPKEASAYVEAQVRAARSSTHDKADYYAGILDELKGGSSALSPSAHKTPLILGDSVRAKLQRSPLRFASLFKVKSLGFKVLTVPASLGANALIFTVQLRANVCKNRAKSKFRGHSQKIIFAHILSIDRHK